MDMDFAKAYRRKAGPHKRQKENNRLRSALEPFAKMADALVEIDKELIITDERLKRTKSLPNYYLTTRDLRAARAALKPQ
jgi:hypothetical protein